jgi:hypothetical protein
MNPTNREFTGPALARYIEDNLMKDWNASASEQKIDRGNSQKEPD